MLSRKPESRSSQEVAHLYVHRTMSPVGIRHNGGSYVFFCVHRFLLIFFCFYFFILILFREAEGRIGLRRR